MAKIINGPHTNPAEKKFFNKSLYMLDKLKWEIGHMQKAIKNKSDSSLDFTPFYCAHNCAITAWHMCDWVFHEFKVVLNAGTAAGFPQCVNSGEVMAHVRSECRALVICEQIAIGSKHFVLERTPSDASIIARQDFIRIRAKVGVKAGEPITRFIGIPTIEVDGIAHDADIFFIEALLYWQKKLVPLYDAQC